MPRQQGESRRKKSETPRSTGPFVFLKSQNTSSVCLHVPLNTTYLFSHDSWLPDQTNESQKSLEETFMKATEKMKQREFRGVLSFKGNFPAASFLWGSSPPCPPPRAW